MARVLRSVDNALAVLESFSVERPELGVTELSHALGLGKSTVHRIHATGYALDNEEFAIGLKCIASPLFDHTRRVVASLGIAGPAVRLDDERLPRLAPLVREAAAGARRANTNT
jgi:DNA-binding IclR family transcriptional regulator